MNPEPKFPLAKITTLLTQTTNLTITNTHPNADSTRAVPTGKRDGPLLHLGKQLLRGGGIGPEIPEIGWIL